MKTKKPALPPPTKDGASGDEKHAIHWFPGHMKKAKEEIAKNLKKVDLILEVRDARAPLVTANLDLAKTFGSKKRLIILNKANLNDPRSTQLWKAWFLAHKERVLFIEDYQPKTLKRLVREVKEITAGPREGLLKKGINPPPIRMMVLGIPNVGKSTLINRLCRHKKANTGDKPGLTKNQAWAVIDKGLELLDTPGVMPPRVQSEKEGRVLCAIHAIRDEIIGKQKVANFVLEKLIKNPTPEFTQRYGAVTSDKSPQQFAEEIGETMNLVKKGGEISPEKVFERVLADFRNGRLGKISLEDPPDVE